MADIIVQTLKVENEASAPLDATAESADRLAGSSDEASAPTTRFAGALADVGVAAKTAERPVVDFEEVLRRIGAGASAATASSDAVADSLRDAGVAAETTGAAAETAGVASEGFRKRADDLGDTASKLAQGLGVVSPELQSLAMLFADVADGAVGLADAAGLSGASMASLGVVAAALAVAVGAVAAVAVDVSREMEIAAEVAETYRKVTDDLRASLRLVEDAELDHAEALGLITTAQREEMAARLATQRAVLDYGASLRDQRAELRETIADNQKFTDVLDSLEGTIFVGAYAVGSLADSVFGWSESTAAAEQQLGLLDVAEQKVAANAKAALELSVQGIAAKDKETQAEERLKVAKTGRAEADRQAAEWTRQAMEVNEAYYAALQRNLDAIRAGEELFYAQASASARLNDSLRPLIERVDTLAPPEALDRVTQLTLLLMELETRAAGSAEANAALADEIERVGSALAAERSTQRITGAARGPMDLSGVASSIGAGFDAVSGSGGDVFAMLGGGANAVGGLLGAAGVAGAAAAVAPVAAVAAALAALVKLTDALVVTGKERGEGETSIIEQGEAFLNDFFTQFAELPAALAEQFSNIDLDVLTDNFGKAVEGFLVGLVENAPALIEALVRGFLMQSTMISNAIVGAIPEVTAALIEVWGNPQTWIDLANAIVEAVKETLKASFDVRRETRQSQSAMIGNAFQGVGDRFRGTGVSVAISGVVGDTREVVRTMRDRLGSLGNGLSFDRDPRWSR